MRRLNAMLPDVERELAAAQLESGQQLARAIASRSPFLTGAYRAALRADLLVNNPSSKALVGMNRTKDKNAVGIYADFKWRWLEFGTVKTRRQPHIFTTYRARRKAIRRRMANAVNRAVRRAQKGSLAVPVVEGP